MEQDKKFYKMKLCESEEGLVIFTHELISIHETPCFNFCVSEFHSRTLRSSDGETRIQMAKRRGNKILRVCKSGSRIAFDTEQKAFESLRYRKTKQIAHLERNLAVVGRFLADTKGKLVDEFKPDGPYRVIPDTAEIVGQYYRFD